MALVFGRVWLLIRAIYTGVVALCTCGEWQYPLGCCISVENKMFLLGICGLILSIFTLIVDSVPEIVRIPKIAMIPGIAKYANTLCRGLKYITGVLGCIVFFMDVLSFLKWRFRSDDTRVRDYLDILSAALQEATRVRTLAIDLFGNINRSNHKDSLNDLQGLKGKYRDVFDSRGTPWEV